MIKANELRLGNYFLLKGKPKKVKHIWPYGVGIPTEEGDDWTQVLEIEDIEPIPLTREILEKARFEKNRDNDFIISMALDFHLSISFYPDGAFPILIKDSEMYNGEAQMVPLNRLDYLHQLQNLYFALTGEELTLDLCTKD
jgi:hypothetical protein